MAHYMKLLARKGQVTVLEHAGGKTTVALQPFSESRSIVTLQSKANVGILLWELHQICKNLPERQPDEIVMRGQNQVKPSDRNE